MKPAILTALLLSACAPATVTRLDGNVNDAMAAKAIRAIAPWVTLPHRGGNLHAARQIVAAIDASGRCVLVDGPVVSATVYIARRVQCVHVTDPTANWFGLHNGSTDGFIDAAGSLQLFIDMRAGGCWSWYQRQPEAAVNGIVYVSWNKLERGCR